MLPNPLSVTRLIGPTIHGTVQSAGFTMIELIVVMGIIVLLISFGAPVYTTITRGGGPRAGVNQVADYLTVVRQKAVASRQRTAVVFAMAYGVPLVDTTNDYITRWVSYAPVIETNAGVWIYLDRWQHLPKGCYFSAWPIPSVPLTVPFPTNSAPPKSFLAAVEFTPAGEAVGASTSFTVSEGTVVGGGVVSVNAYNIVSASVYRVTGLVKVYR